MANTLKEWKLRCPARDTGRKDVNGEPIKEQHLVFPTGNGNIESRGNLLKRMLWPAQVAVGVTVPSWVRTASQ